MAYTITLLNFRDLKVPRINNILCLTCLILSGCFSKKISHPSWFQQLEGNWKANTPEGPFIEQWYTLNDSTLSGKGMVLSPSNDTSFTEELSITKTNSNQWEYKVILPNAREFRTIVFSSSNVGNRKIHFTHPSNDFPAVIRYNVTSKNRLRVTLYPKEGSEGKTEHLKFKRTAQ